MDIKAITINNQKEAEVVMKQIGVDSGGIKIMAPKSVFCLIRINKLSNIAANILKQETLSIGADTAVSRDTLTGKTKYTDCLIMGNLRQIERLSEKLKFQPYSLSKIALCLERAISNYYKKNFVLQASRFRLNLGLHTHIMGIVNMSPDSFSADGLLGKPINRIVDIVLQKVRDGADIIDVGGESSRPGARPIPLKVEISRTIPLIKELAKKIKIPISIDTYKSEVACRALDNGASIVNDITALNGDQRMAKVIKKHGAALILMHMRKSPINMQNNPKYSDLMNEIINYLEASIKKALDAGIKFDSIVTDPGIGFGKTLSHNIEIISHLRELKVLGRPILIGTSRKSFIGKIFDSLPQDRLYGSLASVCMSALNGASIVRVHDVKETKEALKVLDRIIKC